MSAFVVSHDHIDALLTFADRCKMDWGDSRMGRDLTQLGRLLLMENLRSVLHRYPGDTEDDCPGRTGERVDGYEFKLFEPFLHMPPGKLAAWVIKACHCFDYQACETDDYERSRAHSIIRAIESAAIQSLPHYEDAPWGIDRARVREEPKQAAVSPWNPWRAQ